MKRTLLSSLALAPALLLAALLVPGSSRGRGPDHHRGLRARGTGTVTCNLWAETGTLALPGAAAVTVWGYADLRRRAPTVPGPVARRRPGRHGHRQPDQQPHPAHLARVRRRGDGRRTSTAVRRRRPATPYTFTASTPGTYLYEAGILPGLRVPGRDGPVRRADRAPGGRRRPGLRRRVDRVRRRGPRRPERDRPGAERPAAEPAGTFDLREFAPKYFLVNGKAYANTRASTIPVTSGNTLLLRYVNAGIQHHSIGVLGLHQRVLAADGSELPYPRTMVAETIAPGQTADVLRHAAGDDGRLHAVPALRRRPGAQQQHRVRHRRHARLPRRVRHRAAATPSARSRAASP